MEQQRHLAGHLKPIFISLDDANYRDAIVSLTASMKKRNVLLFAGAGVSKPSGLPLSDRFTGAIIGAMGQSMEIIGLGSSSERDILQNIICKYPLERLLDSLVSTLGFRATGILSVLESGKFNYNHWATAQLVSNGYLDSIVTLNFDVLFEQALLTQNTCFTWHLPLAGIKQKFLSSKAKTHISKPHGSLPIAGYPYEDYYLAATLRFAGDRPQTENIAALRELSELKPVLFVAGYRNNDWDISPIITSTNWSHVFWVEHLRQDDIDERNIPNNKPCEKIEKWLSEFQSASLLYGDVQRVFEDSLIKLNIAQDVQNIADNGEHQQLSPNIDVLLEKPAATALAAISLLDGTQNTLYRSLLMQLGDVINELGHTDVELSRSYSKSLAWLYHAHYRKLRESVTIRKDILANSGMGEERDELELLSEYLALYYDYISLLKRPYLNPLWPVDLWKAWYYRKKISHCAEEIKSTNVHNPWLIKESDRHIAFSRYYLIDLLHNLGYHLLPFRSWIFRKIARGIFGNITDRYQQLASDYPTLDWEYHFVRSVEAGLLAGRGVDMHEKLKLKQISAMFESTGQSGHLAYTDSILAIINSNKKDFKIARERLFDANGVITPTGMLRMILFERYFWPEDVPLFTAIKGLWQYSRIQTVD